MISALSLQTASLKSALLADFIHHTRFQDLPADITHKTVRHILDTVGAAIAGAAASETERLTKTLHEVQENGDATLLGQTTTVSPLAASLINGTAAHAFELDDTGGCDHSGAVVIPAALAAVECARRPVSGEDFITAVGLGYDLARRALEACGAYEAHNGAGFHSTGTCGTFGAAAACAKLLRLTPHETQMALGLAGSFSSGLWCCVHDGAQSKRLHAGHAAWGGLLSALSARHGMTGPAQIFEEVWGGFNHSFAPATSDPNAWLRDLGTYWKIARVSIKPYASCRSTHSSIDAVNQIRQAHPFSAEEVDEITVIINPFVFGMCGKYDVIPMNAAQLSIPYCLAAALVFDDVSLASFDETHRRDPRIRAMMQRIRFEVDASQKDDDEPIVCVRLNDGQSLQTQVPVPLGAPTNPITDEALMKKFRSVTGLILAPQEVSKLADALLTLPQCEDLRTSLLPLTVPSQKRCG